MTKGIGPITLPESLAAKDIREAVAVGLFHLSIGYKPSEIPKEKQTSARLVLSENAQQYLNQIIHEYKSQREAIIHALAWVKEQPIHIRQTRL